MSEQNIQTNVKAEAVVTAPKKVHKQSVEWMLYDVLIALAPTVIYAIWAYGVYAIRNILLPAKMRKQRKDSLMFLHQRISFLL